MGIFMLFVVPVITFFYGLWYVKVPRITNHTWRDNIPLEPIGLKVWILFLIIILSIIPIVNLIAILSSIIMLVFELCDEGYDRVFGESKTLNSLGNFLNKDITKPKKK